MSRAKTTRAAAFLALLIGAAAPVAAASEPTSECEVAGTAASAADTTRALAACEIARARFAELFGEPVPDVRLILRHVNGYRTGVQGERAAIVWPTTRAMAARVGTGEAAAVHIAAQWREVLPHEIAHVLLAARFFGEERTAAHEGYGTPLPDWFDEAVAIWAEPLESRRRRIAQARALPEARRDLRAIVTATHPGAGNAAALATRDGAAVPDDPALWAFYPQSIAVLAFVHDAGGGAAVRELARRLLADPADPEALAGLPGLPDDFDGVIAAWEAWLGAGPAERRAGG